MTELYQFERKLREAYETSVLPFAVYQYADGKVHVLLVSEGLCKMSGLCRNVLLDRLQNDMYKRVHPQDVYAVVESGVKFATEDKGEYNVVYRERLGDDQDYTTLHVVGEHIKASDGTKLAIIRYDNISIATKAMGHVWNEMETEDLEENLQDQKFINDHLDQAIANGEIQVYYQPVIRTLDRKLCGYEALARWISPSLGFLAPYRFIPALEASRQIYKLDCCMIEQVCRQYREDVDAGLEVVPVSFNLSRIDFEMCDIFTYIQDTAAKYQVPHSFLHIEITETTFSADEAGVKETISRFHEAGYEVWMDDFGSGYSSLNSLKDHRFDQLKIDMEFLRSFTDRSKEIIRSMVEMAKRIGIHTLAEGVETEEHYEFLRSVGCEKVQGYYFGKPLPLRESLEQVLEKGVYPESKEDAAYYSKAGIRLISSEEPYAVIEYDGKHAKHLYMNKDYVSVLHTIGLTTLEEAITVLNSEDVMQNGKYQERIQQAIDNGGDIHFVLPLRGHYLTISIRILVQEGERICFKQIISKTIVEAQSNAAAKEEQQEHSKKRGTILIADDEPINYMLLNEMLQDEYTILYAENGEKALQMLKDARGAVSAVLLDMVMPVMDGMQVLREIRRHPTTKYTPVLVMTSATDMQEDVLTEGASQFLPKPFEAPEIIRVKIRNEIDKYAKMRGFSFKSMENLPGGVFIYQADSEEVLLYANQKTLDLFECHSMEELLELTGGSFKGFVHESDYPQVEESIKKQIQESENKKDHVQYRIRTKSGKIRSIDEIGQLTEDENLGKVYYVFISESN